ncbi:hypothetical protein ASG54_18240 [Aureimonas sp. Leaf460]|nr:hypothetical protein ASG62_23325 [Aureimonas sp. Leaf427]KQT72496.1 hypothetical protein ASG54_18240 [Aureimonas sp. Leaf460]
MPSPIENTFDQTNKTWILNARQPCDLHMQVRGSHAIVELGEIGLDNCLDAFIVLKLAGDEFRSA